MGLSRSVIPNPFDSKLASRGCLLETGLAMPRVVARWRIKRRIRSERSQPVSNLYECGPTRPVPVPRPYYHPRKAGGLNAPTDGAVPEIRMNSQEE